MSPGFVPDRQGKGVGEKSFDSFVKRIHPFIFVCKRFQSDNPLKMSSNSEKTCHTCGQKIMGRVDKRFCSDQCRSNYNNKLNSDRNRYIKNINNTLRKNRRILVELNTTGKSKVHVDKLNQEGFNFNYFTSMYTTKEGAIYRYCYDQGYLSMDKNMFLLVVKKEM